MLSRLSDSNQWETATKRIDIRTGQCSSICESGIKLTVASPGVRVGIRSLGKRVRARPRTSNDGGQALLEFALVLPILLLLVTGIITFAIAFHNYLELTDAVNVGARFLAISRGQTSDPCGDTATKIENAAPLLTPAKITFTFVLNGTTYSGASCSCPTTTTGPCANVGQGETAQVTATYPYTLSIFGASASSGTMTAQTTELIQ
jgi:Flp pilus assembly protein TadG